MHIVFEGDRLCNLSFFKFVASLPNTELAVIFITAGPETLKKRHKLRKDCQTDVFLKSRETKVNNLKGAVKMMSVLQRNVSMVTYEHETNVQTNAIVAHIAKQVGV